MFRYSQGPLGSYAWQYSAFFRDFPHGFAVSIPTFPLRMKLLFRSTLLARLEGFKHGTCVGVSTLRASLSAFQGICVLVSGAVGYEGTLNLGSYCQWPP